MKKTIALTATLAFVATAGVAGVSSISKADITTSGHQAYKIVCTNGKEYRIWWASGQWYDGWGAQGGQSRNLNEQAAFLCR